MYRKQFCPSALAMIACVSVLVFTSRLTADNLDGFLSTPDVDGLVSGADWAAPPDADGVRIAWEASDNQDGTWHYEYWVTNQFGDPLEMDALSHMILGLSDNITEDDLFDFSESVLSWDIDEFGPGPSNPGFPKGETIFGLKVDLADNSGNFAFNSTRQPHWTDVFGKGGTDSFAYNTDLGVPVANPSDFKGIPVDEFGNELFKILAPNEIPEPSTLTLFGLAVLCSLRRRR